MANYQKLYLKAFNAITDTILYLQKLQLELEEEYVKSCKSEDAPKIIKFKPKDWFVEEKKS